METHMHIRVLNRISNHKKNYPQTLNLQNQISLLFLENNKWPIGCPWFPQRFGGLGAMVMLEDMAPMEVKPDKEWISITKLSRLLKDMKIKSLEKI